MTNIEHVSDVNGGGGGGGGGSTCGLTTVLIDQRETSLIAACQNQFDYAVANLDVADIQIQRDGQTIFLIERKTITDYIASIRDKRLKNQLVRMKKMQKEALGVVKIIILLEGNLEASFGYSSPCTATSAEMLYHSVLHRLFNDNVIVLRSESVTQSATWLKHILQVSSQTTAAATATAAEIASACHDSVSNVVSYLDTVAIKKKANMTPENCFTIQLAQIPGVSVKIAERIIKDYPNTIALVQAYLALTEIRQRELLLANIACESRKVGPVVSSRIYHFIRGT